MVQCPKCSVENPPDSRFCNSCGEGLSSLSQMPTVVAPEGEKAPAPVNTPHVRRLISSDSIPAGGFTPGTILADRYRIIGLLGRGGMGEVYRADDLKLGQPVALKFLPPKLAEDSVRRERFFAEVRITRQLSHPNICRVYDIGDIEGRHFLSMEYIDGEDLASLMTRIGHLTNEKALDIARQLIAGLSVAHERGVLHRDLKPANIMLDGHGRVRITDFGLAIAADDESQVGEIAGTPAYMAPEQLAGKGATVRSDIYSLGLILYEIYTGKNAFKAKTLAELREQKETHTPRAPSEILEGIDPGVERVIQRCMEKDPNSRPASVAQLAQALPGGDPLAAAIAAGETPSPEMVAASGSKEGLRPAAAWGILAFIIAGTLLFLALNDRVMLHRRISFDKHPETLVEHSREILKKAGYSNEFEDSAYGFTVNSDLLRHIEASDKTANRWKTLDAKAMLFWYRQSPRPLEANSSMGFGNPTLGNPPMQFSEEVLVVLDAEGHLVLFHAVPPQKVESTLGIAAVPDWGVFFDEAGLDFSQWTPTDALWSPRFYADTRTAWKNSLSHRPDTPDRVEAAAFQGQPVSFTTIYPWTRAVQMVPAQRQKYISIVYGVFISFLATLIVGGLYFARRNLRLGRGDRRNATRLAFIAASLTMLGIVQGMHHVMTLSELGLFLAAVGTSLFVGGLLGILYIAVEPQVRRRWPQILVSWTRLFSGDWRDPYVARDAIAGCAFGILLICTMDIVLYLVPSWFGYVELAPLRTLSFAPALEVRFFISSLLGIPVISIYWNLGAVCLLFFLKIVLKNQKATVTVWILIWTLTWGSNNLWAFALLLFLSVLWYFVLMRFGLLGMVFAEFTRVFFTTFPINLDSSAWYSNTGYVALAIFAAIVLYAFRTSLGGRPLFGTPQLDD